MRATIGLVAILLSASGAAAQPYSTAEHLSFGVGAFDVTDDAELQFSAEYRGEYLWYGLRPMFGASADVEGGLYGYGGLHYDFFVTDEWVISPNFAVGLYERGDSKRLGGPIEFRSGLEVDYVLENAARVGVTFNHISNASIYDKNPGAESLMLIYSHPIDLF